ncbi:MAG: methionine synthase [Candidatus Eremiobacteraeota bacterium]|nr:methionine synthase [Candidatus Eremiobacteraeota bacterium]MBC5801419.1 methionine synthase [Candidatus Eremiobacteraeota bacterium]MBC5821378.1 methionine synthase [Candidatus Eremiobacteraeota bacterium]
MASYLESLDRRVLVFDGAMGTEMMARDLMPADFGGARYAGCNEALVLSRPDLVADVHQRYLAAGADVIETDSFTASRLKLDEYGLGEHTGEINHKAATLARAACDAVATQERPRFVAGSLGPTGMLISSSDPALSKVTYDELATLYGEQARYLVEGGADLLLLETSQDLLEIKAAVAGIAAEFERGLRRVPIQAQATLDVTGRMLLGTDIRAVTATLDALPIDIIGLNCSTGPTHMRDAVRYLVENSRCYVAVIPNAGLPLMGPKGETIYPETPAEMARELGAFVTDFGVNAIGGCCGTTPAHIAAFVAAVAGKRGRAPEPKPLQFAASSMTATALKQDGSPLLVGERINAQGSRRIKRLLLEDDYDEIVLVAREQVEGGAHVLDICTALTERSDEDVQMATLVKRLAQAVETPLMIDSTEAKVVEAALKIYAGRAIVNSVHLENGRTKIDTIMPMVRQHGSAIVALTIDETGMAKSAERKLEVAERIYDIVVGEYGIPPGALIFDALTFTLATGDAEFVDSAVQTIEGIRLIKDRLPGVLTSLGVSNVSFGLKPAARAALNSVMLHHCVNAGLDMALVHAKEIKPYAEIDTTERELCDDLVLNRRPDALARLIEHFESAAPGQKAAATVDDDAGDPAETRVHNAILRRRKDGIEAKLDAVLEHRDPVDALNNVLLPAMKEVGDKFGSGELILPFVLQSAEVMKKAVAHLEQFLEKKEGVTKGTVVLATVFGDVHDIGKNLVNTILTNNGYTVHDLGKQVPMNAILEKAVAVKADAIGLSALLVSTSKQMPVCVAEQDSRRLAFPVMIGGAAINRDFGRRIAFLEDGSRYFEPGVYYAKDAFEGLDIMDALTSDVNRREAFVARMRRDAERARDAARRKAAPPVSDGATARQHLALVEPPRAPFLGARTVERIAVRELWPHYDLRSLYRLSWGAANLKGDEWERLVRDEFEPRLRRYELLAEREPVLAPRVVYGYFPAAGSGDDVIVYAPAEPTQELGRFTFARQAGGEHLCLADYLHEPLDGGASDVIALQVVTVGRDVSERIDALQQAGDYSESYYLHGFSVQAAESLAEHTHERIRAELGIDGDRGKRYSWGYGACPDLSQHELVWRLLDVERALGAKLTEAYQIVPEQSTAAIVMHHPQASYFNAAAVRELAAV